MASNNKERHPLEGMQPSLEAFIEYGFESLVHTSPYGVKLHHLGFPHEDVPSFLAPLLKIADDAADVIVSKRKAERAGNIPKTTDGSAGAQEAADSKGSVPDHVSAVSPPSPAATATPQKAHKEQVFEVDVKTVNNSDHVAATTTNQSNRNPAPSTKPIKLHPHAPGQDPLTDISDSKTLAKQLGLDVLPSWVDLEAIERGQLFYWRYAGLIGLLLVDVSLAGEFVRATDHGNCFGSKLAVIYIYILGGFGVPRIDAILNWTGAMADSKKGARRILETGIYLADWMISGELAKVGGTGWNSAVKVRMIHAAVRSRLNARTERIRKEIAETQDPEERAKLEADILMHSDVVAINQADMVMKPQNSRLFISAIKHVSLALTCMNTILYLDGYHTQLFDNRNSGY
jgi:hypothetical protein